MSVLQTLALVRGVEQWNDHSISVGREPQLYHIPDSVSASGRDRWQSQSGSPWHLSHHCLLRSSTSWADPTPSLLQASFLLPTPEILEFPQVLPLVLSFSYATVAFWISVCVCMCVCVFKTSMNWPLQNLFLTNYVTLGKLYLSFFHFHFLIYKIWKKKWHLHHCVGVSIKWVHICKAYRIVPGT